MLRASRGPIRTTASRGSKAYGKGHTYFTPLGHTEIVYTDPRWTNRLLAAIQYILGDLGADATPSAKAAKK